MLALHIALYAITSAGFVFAVIELGLSAYLVSFFTTPSKTVYGYVSDGESSETFHVKTPAILVFLLFSALWSMLVCVVGLSLPSILTKKGKATVKLNSILGVIFAVLYGVTWVFWLGCFAYLSYTLGPTITLDYWNALIAFAVLLWLIFMALFILTILALCGVLFSDWLGYQSMRNTEAGDTPQEVREAGLPAHKVPAHEVPAYEVPAYEVPAHQATAHEVPSSTVPAPPPSELSSPDGDVEAMHSQTISSSQSISSPSGITSFELSGDSTFHKSHVSPV